MKKTLGLVLVMLVSVGVSAGEALICDIQQSVEGKITGNSFQVEATDNPHGSIFMFNAEQFDGVSGFVARVKKENKEFVVMNIQSSVLQMASSSQHQVIGKDQYFHHQLILPSKGMSLNAIVIDCQF